MSRLISAIDRILRAIPPRLQPIAVALFAWLLSLLLYSPPLWIGVPPDARLWDLVSQAENPLRRDLNEPILAFRVVPPLLAFLTGLRGLWVLVIQYASALVSLALLFVFTRRRLGHVAAALATLAFALTEFTIASNTWLGYPDAVAWCLALAALMTRSTLLKLLLTVTGGLSDERFVLAVPGLVLIDIAEGAGWRLSWRLVVRYGSPYVGGVVGLVVARSAIARGLIGEPVHGLVVYELLERNLRSVIPPWLAAAPGKALGSLAFSFRWLWVLPFGALLRGGKDGQRRMVGLALVYVPAVVYLVCVGGDWTRSLACLFPVFILAVLVLGERDLQGFQRTAIVVIFMMVVTPMVNIERTGTRLGWVRPLPVSLARAVRENAFPERWLRPEPVQPVRQE